VVKIYSVYNEYDYYRPWQMRGKYTKTGSGCIIEGKRILTNAHVVADQTFIQVKRAGQAVRYVATVEMVAHELDLAILRVEDESFFEGTNPLVIGKLPKIRDKVAAYGFPEGGTEIAITEGVVSRVEHITYSHSQAYLLCCQIDAPINNGSSGGPVISGGKVAGVAFQSLSGQSIGYMVPAPIIEYMLEDIEDGTYDGVPTLALSYQNLENPALRKKYKMSEEESGILVIDIFYNSPCRGVLQTGDILLSIDDMDIANDATVEFRRGERTFYEYAVQTKHIGDSASLTFLREGKQQTHRIPLTATTNAWYVVPRMRYDFQPSFYISGGMVFVPLSMNLLSTWGKRWIDSAPKRLTKYLYDEPRENRRELVTLIQVLSDEVNVGYEDMVYGVIDSVNGKHIAEMHDIVDAFESNTKPYHTIIDMDRNRMVLSTDAVEKHNEEILLRYKVDADRSKNLRN
jgi:S1-C subfamily serine protease